MAIPARGALGSPVLPAWEEQKLESSYLQRGRTHLWPEDYIRGWVTAGVSPTLSPCVKPVKQTLWTDATVRAECGSCSQARFTQRDCKAGATFLSCIDFRFLGSEYFTGGKVFRENHSQPTVWAETQAVGGQSPVWCFQVSCQPRELADTSTSSEAQFCTFPSCSELPACSSHTHQSGSGGSILAPWNDGNITKHQ